jgi:hypothetical protein
MRHYRIDWTDLYEPLEKEDYQLGWGYVLKALKEIDEVFGSDGELKGLNLPIYGFIADEWALNTDIGQARLFCGNKHVMIPLKRIAVIEDVIPCNRAHACIEAVVKTNGKSVFGDEAEVDPMDMNKRLAHICIKLDSNVGTYNVITTVASRVNLTNLWTRYLS